MSGQVSSALEQDVLSPTHGADRATRGRGREHDVFCETVDPVLQAVALIELARAGWVESIRPQTRCWAVLVHQVFAMTLQHGAVSADDARVVKNASRARRRTTRFSSA